MTPLYLKGFEHFSYVNLDETIDDADFSNWILSVFDAVGNEIASDIGTLTQDVISGSDFRFSMTFTIPETLNDGTYQLVVYNSTTDDLKYISNKIRAFSSRDVEKYIYVEYRNSTNMFNYNYEDLNDYNTVFLPLNLIEQQPEIELQQYFEQTTGRRRNQRSITSKVLRIETYFFDDEAHDMMLALSTHDDIRLNEKTVDVKTAYQIQNNQFNSVQKGEIEFYEERFSTINLNG